MLAVASAKIAQLYLHLGAKTLTLEILLELAPACVMAIDKDSKNISLHRFLTMSQKAKI